MAIINYAGIIKLTQDIVTKEKYKWNGEICKLCKREQK